MHKLIAGSLAGSGLFLLMVLDTLLPGGPHIPMGVVFVPFALAFVCFLGVMNALTGSYFGRLPMSRMWPLLRLLPPPVKAAGAVLLIGALVNFFVSSGGVTDEADFQRTFAGNGVWISAAAAILGYAVLRRDRMPVDARPVESVAARRWWMAGSVVFGAALVATWLFVPHVFDERATHEDLQARFGSSGWVSHLVAADTSHGSFRVYLDSEDSAVAAEACASLRQYAADLGRSANLYFFDGAHQPSRLPSC
ncbi:hypothetical protein [Catellatospora vulcania]|uniref:hypothetical protein n=1 Tax=Catellatospora vulcania TaxID=1460450 RepID=UPI0012D4C21D|nr:hypothetical protein [Catellatospora vulcania]